MQRGRSWVESPETPPPSDVGHNRFDILTIPTFASVLIPVYPPYPAHLPYLPYLPCGAVGGGRTAPFAFSTFAATSASSFFAS